MKDYFTTYSYIYKSGVLKLELYSRTDETANLIIDYWNQCTNFHWTFKKKKKIEIDEEPYKLEREEIEYAKSQVKVRQERLAKGLWTLEEKKKDKR